MPTLATTHKLHVSGVPTDLAQRIRADLVDDFDNRLSVQSCLDAAPCRHCLRFIRVGEPAILFAYRPFDTRGPYAEIGPVFIHADSCAAYSQEESLPAEFVDRPRLFRAYNAAGEIIDAELAAPGDHASVIERLFAIPGVSFIHARSPTYGCFTVRIENR